MEDLHKKYNKLKRLYDQIVKVNNASEQEFCRWLVTIKSTKDSAIDKWNDVFEQDELLEDAQLELEKLRDHIFEMFSNAETRYRTQNTSLWTHTFASPSKHSCTHYIALEMRPFKYIM